MKLWSFNKAASPAPGGRKYPIQKDEAGHSLRKRAFILFKEGKRAVEVAKMLGMKPATASRYFSEWNQCPPNCEGTYSILKKALKTKGELSPRIVGMISTARGMPEWEVVEMLSQPHGLKQLIKGDLPLQRKKLAYNSQEQRLEAALSLVVLYEQSGIPVDLINREIRKLLDRLIRSSNANRGNTDLGTTEDNIPDDA
jgi:hypothetical protein